jgi:hypothetical protein
LGATLFTISNNMFVEANHAQLFGVSFVPVMAVLVSETISATRRGNPNTILIWGIAAAALYAAWLLTTFYMAWYFVFFGTFLFLAYLLIQGRGTITAIRGAVRAQPVPIGIVAAAFVVFTIPFLVVYAPKALETGMHSFAEVLKHTLAPLDVINVDGRNFVYGRILILASSMLPAGFLGSDYEQFTGIAPVLLLLFGCGVVWLWRNRQVLTSERDVVLCAIALATVGTWILALRIDGVTLWWLVYHLFPGAQAARVVARYQIFLSAPVIIVALYYLSQHASKIAVPVLGLICAVLLVEEINVGPPLGIQRLHEVQRLASVPAPPPACRAFFVTHERAEGLYPDVDAIYNHNVDAMIIGETKNIPTLNGYATFVPPNWHLDAPESPDYISRVKAFVAFHPVPGLCRLDLRSLAWSTKPFA